jgi:hypothetical protein
VSTDILTPDEKGAVRCIISTFENGTPKLKYGSVARHKDGPGGIRQLTYGWCQFTDGSDSLDEVLRRYMEYTLAGVEAHNAADFTIVKNRLPRFVSGRKADILANANDTVLHESLERLGADVYMRRAQHEVFDEGYLNKALRICAASDFLSPLSVAVVCDSLVQGSFALIRDQIDSKLGEREWITNYLTKRTNWLRHHPKTILKGTRCRPESLLRLAATGNWELKTPFTLDMSPVRGEVTVEAAHIIV